jgi:hypothetical protein
MSLDIKGISYGIENAPADVVRRDLRAIREDLHCTTVMLISTNTQQQIEAAQYALEAGLDVYIRPYLADRPHSEILTHLAATSMRFRRMKTMVRVTTGQETR